MRRAFPWVLAVALPLALMPSATWAQEPSVAPDAPLPPGHPPVGDAPAAPGGEDGLPPGHPAMGEDDPRAGAPPGGGADPEKDLRERIYRPPPDGAGDDAALPRGTIVITIRDAQDQPLPNAPVTLEVLHSSVAKGESRERFAKETDAKGEARFDHLGTGSGITYRVATTRGPATYTAQPFALSDRTGKRAVLHSFEVSQDVERMPVLTEAVVFVALREDAIVVEQLVTVLNLGPVAWYADAMFALPAGFKAFNKQEATGDARVEEVSGKGAALRGTFGPGSHEIDFRYQIPLDDNARQAFRVDMPPHTWKSRVMAEAAKNMGLEVAGFPQAERTQGRDGKRLLVTQRLAAREEGGQHSLDITLTGLPTPGPGRWVAVVLAVVALVAGLSSLGASKGRGLDPDARKDLEDAREALLGELVTLERMHKKGEIGPKTYARVRASLLDALTRVVEQLAQGAKPAAKGGSDGGGRPQKKRGEKGRAAATAARRPA